MSYRDILVTSGIYSFAATILLGLFVYFHDRKNPLNIFFGIFTLTAGVWSLGSSLENMIENETWALWTLRVCYLFAIILPPVFIQFTHIVAKVSRAGKKWVITSYCISVLMLPIVFSSLFIRRLKIIDPYNYRITDPGPAYYIFLCFFSIAVSRILFLMYGAAKNATGVARKQMQYIFIAHLVAVAAGFDYFASVLGLVKSPPLDDYLLLLYFVIFAYAVVKYRAMDISTVIHKTIMWFVTSSLIIFPVTAIFYFGQSWIVRLSNLRLSLLVAILFASAIPYIKVVQPRIDHLFQRRKYDMQKILQGMVQELAALKDLNGLINKIADTIQEALYVSKTTLVLWDDKTLSFKMLKGEIPGGITFLTQEDTFLSWLKEQDQVIEWDEIELDPKSERIRPAAEHYFKKFEAKIALPLTHDNKLIGLVNLGEKDNLKPFYKMDLDFLSNLRAEASIALSNSLLYDDVSKMSEELRQWAIGLEQKVEKRTKELAESKRELEQSYQKLQELDQLKSKFFANISHELRTPLTLILAPTEMLLNRDLGSLTKGQEKYLGIMQTNSLRLLKLINTLLDLAKVDAGKMEVYYHRSDFKQFLRDIVTSVSPMAEKKSLILKFESAAEIPEFFFDPDKIEKVVLNLVFNALKFTEKGEIKVSCSIDQNQALVKISDSGIGIPKEHMSKLFSRFSQADGSASRKFEGTGIGLALAKELVDLHHGKIWAESEEGRGTTFFFTIPIYTRLEDVPGALNRRVETLPVEEKRREEDWTKTLGAQANIAAVGVLREDSFPEEEQKADDHRHRVLLIDDNADMLSYIATQLQEEYHLLFAKDGREGLDRALSDMPDLIISDVMMPYKDGYQLCREVKDDPRTCHIPVVLLTAKTDLSTKIEGLQHGADDYLTKPFDSRELKARVRSLLSLRKLEREIQLRSRELEETLHELKETQGQLVQSEKMAALGLLVAGVAHEINNPVSFAKGSLATVRRCLDEVKRISQLSPDEVAELNEDLRVSVDVIKNGLERTETIVSNLKSFVRKDEGFFKKIDLHAGLDSTLQLFQHELTYKVKIHRAYGEIQPIEAIPGQLNQAFMNIIQNAVHSISDKGEIHIKTEQSGDQIIISIRDTGCGIKEQDISKIFDPFYTTKEVGKGTGLGMTITYKIIQTHNGKIEVKSKVGSGTEVLITLPVLQPENKNSVKGGLYARSAPI
jgi:signal transduction histidine kinase